MSAPTKNVMMPDLGHYTSVFTHCETVDIARAADIARADYESITPLWGQFWNEGEICVFFAPTNAGKSIVAVQIAAEIARSQPVIYFDYEMSDVQFHNRYADAAFPPDFYRASSKSEALEALDFDAAILDITRAVDQGFKIVIVDNITFLTSSIKDPTASLNMMKRLKSKVATSGASLLLIAHTPKRNASLPLTGNDIAGSSNILNFADSAFALGRSYLDDELRYLKQIKVRAGEFAFTEANVLVGKFEKNDGMLEFMPIVEQEEYLHLQQ
ncbi:MAG: AAA family ATPase [Muribaculaceae bacterium]|nr:AAA family ATPase [Muribaculaceae bacterium]